jgi:hypothetical protein
MDYFKGAGENVGGMAWGGKYNTPGQGQGQPSSIVPNPYYYKNNPQGQNALVKLEASRHWMNENEYDPKFKITPAMQEWREKQFKGIEAGQAYLNDDKAFRQTIISRIIGGDSNIPKVGQDVIKQANNIESKLEAIDKASKPTITQSIMSAMGMKKK